jgi:hypothetical protein
VGGSVGVVVPSVGEVEGSVVGSVVVESLTGRVLVSLVLVSLVVEVVSFPATTPSAWATPA